MQHSSPEQCFRFPYTGGKNWNIESLISSIRYTEYLLHIWEFKFYSGDPNYIFNFLTYVSGKCKTCIVFH